ncbi:NDR1/HIN1-like protein 3 [Iris pallida]|uniref:NDR1/HIN1-like protein 3 n=1 Tax=Iris pallida TaxID=29817 RepID=A0AAX6FVM6_IRIPA|nr:NDR1/HIN1-like protein 3 [Iris pallida]
MAMADPKQQQVQLNGAYYGPPVPPRSNTYHSAGRRGGSGSCCCCLFTTLLKLIISAVVTVGIIALVLWLIFRPHRIQVHVESASLTQFNLTSTNALAYNLTMDISVRNPNRRIAFYYDRIEARAIYDGYRFGYDPQLPAFYQGHDTTTTLRPEFQGQQPALGSVAGTFDREKGEGSFYLQVELHAKLRMKLLKFVKVGHFKPKIDCNVKLPVPSSKGSFERTKCDVDWH